MPAQAAQAVVDSLEFARTGQRLSGSVPVAAMSRLQDSLLEQAGEVKFELRGGHDALQRPVLALEISGVLRLQCQRCLGALDYELRLSNSLLLSNGEPAGAGEQEEGEADWIEPSTELDVAGLVEDEILLSLPYAPRHGEGQCPRVVGEAAGGGEAGAFARLAALKRNSN